MARSSRDASALLTLLFLAGCARGGDFREISFTADLTPGDLAHYCKSAPGKLEDASVGIPFIFLPVLYVHRESTADVVAPDAPSDCDRYHYHFEQTSAFAVLLAVFQSTANFDQAGKNLSWVAESAFLFNMIRSSVGQRFRADGTRADTKSFSIFWGLYSTAQTAYGHHWSNFWFPIGVGGEKSGGS